MCGISILIQDKPVWNDSHLTAFTEAVAHRGPDDCGFAKFADAETMPECSGEDIFSVGFGHRRLSILDLSPAGHQPMFSMDGRLSIVYNGEIYNYIELREELKSAGHSFNSDCDTEVILAAYLEWGADCVKRFNGMWAFAILDRISRQVFISRDRLGIKPLYWSQNNNGLALASEIKQFFELPNFSSKPNISAVLTYLINGYELPPETFYQEVFAFPPGHFAIIDIEKPEIRPVEFWNAANFAICHGRDETSLQEEIREIFADAVRLRLRSDVPVGGCLSGGLDSSAIFMLMHQLAPEQQFNAFSACFEQADIDERPFMNKIIAATGSRHHQVFPVAEEFAADLDKFLVQHDEPVASISMYAQYRVMRRAREERVPVLLDGQGGDELFSGYWTPYLLRLNRLRQSNSYAALATALLSACLPGGNQQLIREGLSHYCEYRRRARRCLPYQIRRNRLGQDAPPNALNWHIDAQQLDDAAYRRAEICRIHLPRLLKWEDRNSMAFAIESRVPFLDYRLVELLLSVPPAMNMKKGWTKLQFRYAMNDILPHDICWRKDKKGFETPQQQWLRSGLLQKHLQIWAERDEHPAAEFLENDFRSIGETLKAGRFDTGAIFRLYCLDQWLRSLG